MIEVNQGPYLGDKDKVCFEDIAEQKIKID